MTDRGRTVQDRSQRRVTVDRARGIVAREVTADTYYGPAREILGDTESEANSEYQYVAEYCTFEEDTDDMSKPILFYGKPEQLTPLINYCNLKFECDDAFDGNKRRQAAYFATLFRGVAATWLAGEIESDPTIVHNYVTLQAKCKDKFGVSDAAIKSKAERELATLTQRTSVLQYALRFEQLVNLLGWNEDAKLAAFKRGLKLHIREAIITQGQNYSSLEKISNEAQRIDDELYSAKRSGAPRFSGQRQGGKGSQKCFGCGKFGHKKADCKSSGGSKNY